MNRIHVSLVALGTVAMIGCSDSPTAPPSIPSLAPSKSAMGACDLTGAQFSIIYDIPAYYGIEGHTGIYPHLYTVTVQNGGTLTGVGSRAWGDVDARPVDETFTGTISWNTLSFRAVWNVDASYFLEGSARLAPDGGISGSGLELGLNPFTVSGSIVMTSPSTVCQCNTAPSIATDYLRGGKGLSTTDATGRAILSQVTNAMGPGTDFQGHKRCGFNYLLAVVNFVDSQLPQ